MQAVVGMEGERQLKRVGFLYGGQLQATLTIFLFTVTPLVNRLYSKICGKSDIISKIMILALI